MNYIAPTDLPLLDFLAQLFPQNSKNSLRDWIKSGRIEINSVPVYHPSTLVLAGQQLMVLQRQKIIRSTLPILYEDEDLVVIHKPSGLLSVSTVFEKGETALALLKKHFLRKKVFAVHRLDQDSSGVLVFALNELTCNKLKELFEAHTIERSYTAILEGKLSNPNGTWVSYQYEDSSYYVHDTNDSSLGREAITHYQTLGFSSRYSWVELQLETGRKNQIRVHCQSAGHSIVGDKKYGARSNPVKRLCLHAHLLAFQHPTSRKKMSFESPIPDQFYQLVPANSIKKSSKSSRKSI
jgi:23S rRNA pseudouridine1911/1915/1917 synthase